MRNVTGTAGPGVTAVIAALNEAASIGDVIEATLRYVPDVLAMDGGSEDGTSRIAAQAGARVVECLRKGKGHALRQAIADEAADILVFIDADGSHDAADIPRLIEPIARGEVDLVVGSRVPGGSDELDHDPGHAVRALGTHVLQAIVNLRFATHLTDMQNGFRAIRTPVARDLALREPGFCIEEEMVIQCLRRGYRVLNVPSHEYRRRHGRSKLRVWAEGPRFLWTVLSLCARPRVRGPQARSQDG